MAMIPPRPHLLRSATTVAFALTSAILALSTGALRAINPPTDPPVETLVGGNHSRSHVIIPFTDSFSPGSPLSMTPDYSTGGDGIPWISSVSLTGGQESEGSSPQSGSGQCSCACNACEMLPYVTPLLGAGDGNVTGVSSDTMKLVDGSGSTVIGGIGEANMASAAIRLGGNRMIDNSRAAVSHGNLFHLAGDLSAADRASPAGLRAQFGMGGELRFASGRIRQWLGDRDLIDVIPIDSGDLNAGYTLRMYANSAFPDVDSGTGLYKLDFATEFLKVEIIPITGGIKIKQSIPGDPTDILDLQWTMTRSGTSPNYEYTALLEKPDGESIVGVRRHKCALQDGYSTRYMRTVEDYLDSTWTTVFKMKEVWATFTLADSSVRRRLTLQDRYANGTDLAERREWTYYTDATDGAQYGRAKTRRDYGLSGGTAYQVYWEDYGYASSSGSSQVNIYRSFHGSPYGQPSTPTVADYSDDERIYIQYPSFTPESGCSLEDYPERPVVAYLFQAGKVARKYERTVTTGTTFTVTESQSTSGATSLTTTREYYGPNVGWDPEARLRPKRFVYPDGTIKTWELGEVSGFDPHGNTFEYERQGYTSGGTDYFHLLIKREWNHQGVLVKEEVLRQLPMSVYLTFTLQAIDGFPDIHGRPLKFIYNGNSSDYETFTWGCCGLEYHRGRDGSTTAFMIDNLKRLISRTEHNGTTASLIHSTTFLPSAGINPFGMKVEQSTGGLLDMRIHYDAASRIVQFDRLDPGGTADVSTTVAHVATSGGLRQTTITYPDTYSSTEIRRFYGDGSQESVTGTAVADTKFEYGQTVNSTYYSGWLDFNSVKTIRLDSSAGTAEYSVTHRDLMGRIAKQDQAKQGGGVATETYLYDGTTGQLKAVERPDVARVLYAYNSRGELYRTALDLDNDSTIDLDTDRVQEYTSDLEDATSVDGGLGVSKVDRSYVYLPGDSTPDLVSVSYTAGSGLMTRSESYPTTTGTPQITTWLKTISGTGINLNAGVFKESTTRPDGSQTAITYDLWRNATEQEKDSGSTVIAATTRTWQASGRKLLASSTDTRTGETTFGYKNSGHLITSTLTGPSPDLETQWVHDAMGRVIQTTNPDGSDTHRKYTASGHLWKEWGSQVNSVRYSYDEQGRTKTLETFGAGTPNAEPPDSGGSPDVTAWNYEAATGRLAEKVYADSSEINYAYYDGGKLYTRSWARTPGSQPLVTTYLYTNAGDLLSVDYSDTTTSVLSTPEVLYSYNRTGQLIEVQDGQLASGGTSMSTTRYTHTYTWTGLQPNQETIAGLYHETKVVTRKYQASTNTGSKLLINRPAGYKIGVSATPAQDFEMTYGYDTAGRISSVTDPSSDTFTYAYVADAPHLISSMTGPKHTVTRDYEPYRDVLSSITNTETDGTPSTISKYTYTVNAIGQRTHIAREGSAFGFGTGPMNDHHDRFTYNASGEVASADRYTGVNTSAGSAVSGFDYDWTYDAIGNRKKSSVGSTKTGYVPTNLNQYSKVFNDTDGDGVQDVGESDLSNPVYDADGNLTRDADYDYTYDTENRLVKRTPRTPSSLKLQLTFSYDYRGRRVRILSEYHTGSVWDALYDETILYDGWNPVMHYSLGYYAGNTWRNRSYTWGLDLSGSLQGAGGVGGLLSVTGWLERGNSAASSVRYYYTFDGNGNVSEIFNYNYSNAYALCAHHEYDAFGNLTRLDDNGGWSIARCNPFRFSTKWHDNAHYYEQSGSVSFTLAQSKLYYFGYRYYSPESGFWTNRDPAAERGGLNLYAIALNNTLNFVDPLGLDIWVENANNKEVMGHQSICIGDPNSRSYRCWSFGLDFGSGNVCSWKYGLMGTVYRDVDLRGEIDSNRYIKTFPNEAFKTYDEQAAEYLDSLLGNNGSYRLANSTCRNWSQSHFDAILKGLRKVNGGKLVPPPERKNTTGTNIGDLPENNGVRIGLTASSATSTTTSTSVNVASGGTPGAITTTSSEGALTGIGSTTGTPRGMSVYGNGFVAPFLLKRF